MHFNKSGSGVITGSYGCIFRTVDGINWKLIKNAYPLNGTAFFDKQKGFLYGGFYAGFHDMFPSGDLFSTTDGGKTYDAMFSAHDVFNSCEVINDSVVLLSGKSIYQRLVPWFRTSH